MESLRLRWTEYELNWNQVLADAYYERELTDVLVVCEHGEGIMCHGVVLSACSVLLHELLEETTAECSVVVLDGVRGSHFDVLLKYMYFGEVLVPEGDLEQVLDLACQLRVKGLMEFRASALLGTFHSCEKPESEELRGALSDEVFATSADLFAEEAKFSSRYSELSSAPSSGHNDSLLAAVPATTGCSSLADDNSSLSDEPQLPLFSEPMNNTFLLERLLHLNPEESRSLEQGEPVDVDVDWEKNGGPESPKRRRLSSKYCDECKCMFPRASFLRSHVLSVHTERNL